MAKSRSVLKFNGTLGDFTFVRSNIYGDHVRLKRGTHKKAKVNSVLQKESETTQQANVPAKIFKDAINPYRGVLKDGLLWQRLVSVFCKQIKEHGSADFGKMERMELHTTYQFGHLLHVIPTLTPDNQNSILHVTINYTSHPNLTKVQDIDGYKLTVIAIYPDLEKKMATTVAVESRVIRLDELVAPLHVTLDIPKAATNFVVCLKIDGCIKGKSSETRGTTGLCLVGAGRCSGESTNDQ